MRDKFILSLVLFSLLFNNISASVISTRCYFDQGIKKITEIGDLNSKNCTLINGTEFNNGTEHNCGVPRDLKHPAYEAGKNKEKFELRVDLGHESGNRISVLNVTISNVTFRKLKIKLQDLANAGKKIYEQSVEFKTDEKPQKLSLFFATWTYDRTKIQFFADESDNGFFKEYHYIPPNVPRIANDRKLEEDSIFAYVDTTIQDKVYLHVQPLPERFNITSYEVEFRRVESKEILEPFDRFKLTSENSTHEHTKFENDGNYCFWLIPVDKNGTRHPLTRVASFCMQNNNKMMLIMIVSIGAIPVVMFFTLYIAYIIFRRRILDWLKSRKPYCLIVYSPVHDAHIDVVTKLIEYLKGCQINAMDLLDISNVAFQNPGHWCDEAFRRANAVIVVVSPECKNAIPTTRTPYKDLHKRAANLIHENRRYKDKTYAAVLLPYCKESDVSSEDDGLKLLKIPADLKALVNKIHRTGYTEVFGTPDPQVLISSIETASENILTGKPYSKLESFETLTDILSSDSNTVIDVDTKDETCEDKTRLMAQEGKSDVCNYRTNIEDLIL